MAKTVTRRTLIAGAAGSVVAASAESEVPGASSGPTPNIVYIMADDLGYADVSCYGRPDFETPNIDRIAANGMRFLQGYANSAVCSATRTALITGRYQYRLRIGLEEPLPAGQAEIGLPPEHPTLALAAEEGRLRHHADRQMASLGLLPKFGPLKSGYDRFYGFRGGSIDYFAHHRYRSQRRFLE